MGIFNLHGRVAVVTGGTAGLGRGMAIALARQGADLAILARRPDKLTETAREIGSLGGRCLPVVCDISDEASVQNAVETVVNHYKKVDILVNNAGNGGPSIPTVDMPQSGKSGFVLSVPGNEGIWQGDGGGWLWTYH